MNLILWIAYPVSLGLVVFILFYHLRTLAALKKMAGALQAKWSGWFNLSFPLSWVRWAVVFIYLAWCIYQLVNDPRANYGHMSFMLLAILLSFTPRSNVYLGSSGIIYKMNFIPWVEVKEKKIVVRGKTKYLETELWKIPLPKNIPDLSL